jgi:hypothetical protein
LIRCHVSSVRLFWKSFLTLLKKTWSLQKRQGLSFPASILFPLMTLPEKTVSFPMDACDVYISMKFTGEDFGGNVEEENVIYIDRMVVVRLS